MPKRYEYAGMRFAFFSNDHLPVHLHVHYGGHVEKAELHNDLFGSATIKWKQVQGQLPNAQRRKAENLIMAKQEDIRRKWEAFFKHGETPKPVQIRKLRP